MKLTEHYKLRKPEGTDPIDVADLNANADDVDAALADKLDKTGVATDLITVFSQATVRANLLSGEKTSTSFGKIAKWFADLGTAAFQGVSNTLGITVAGYVLDARAGKQLNDRFGGLRFYEDATGKYVVGADSVPKKLGSAELEIITVGNTNISARVSFDIKPLYSEYTNLTTRNFTYSSCDVQKNGSQGQNDTTRHWYSLEYNSEIGILTCVPHYREWGPGYDRSGEGRGSGPDHSSPILLYAVKL
jgi:hypothetical protein